MEGPSIVILVEEAAKFIGTKVKTSSGSSKVIDIESLRGQKLIDLKSWGKHFLMIFEKSTLKVHFMLFGSYRIDEPKPGMKPRLSLQFKSGELLMYACSIRELDEPISSLYDWSVDVMGSEWDEKLIVKKLQNAGDALICDALLNQEIFAGAGNIIKNEVLFRLKLQPDVKLSALTKPELQLLARETRLYSLQFYIWKKQFLLRKNWQIYRKKTCPICESKIRLEPTGKLKRRSFFCTVCQKIPVAPPVERKSHIMKVKAKLAKIAQQIIVLQKEIPAVISQGRSEREH